MRQAFDPAVKTAMTHIRELGLDTGLWLDASFLLNADHDRQQVTAQVIRSFKIYT